MLVDRFIQYIHLKTVNHQGPSKIFILPTSIGIYFFSTAVLQLVIGVVFSNNLILLFGLILLIFGILTAVITNFHLENIELNDLIFEAGHCGNNLIYTINLKNKLGDHSLSGINLEIFLKEKGKKLVLMNSNVQPGQNHLTGINPLPRGCYQVNHLRVSTSFPLNLFESWRNITGIKKTFYIFPSKIETRLNITGEKQANQITGKKRPSPEFDRIDKYQPGEPKNRIDWKIFARTGEFYKKVFEDHLSPQMKLMIPHDCDEILLSEISTIISQTFENGGRWELEGPDKIFPMDEGRAHYLKCQYYLSIWKSDI